ncbi:MAG: cytidylate kinase-like family protein [Prolixibacteraceae bacterium]
MKNYLLSYLNKRMVEEQKEKVPFTKQAGPVITISREVGCGGLQLCHQLEAELNKSVYCKKWQVISKEVLSESAHELKVAPEKVERLLKLNQHFAFDEILSAFTDKYYKSNRVIMKTVREVIRNFAVDGCCIILGRAGHIIAGDIKNSLHIRLVAPIDWRVSRLAVRKGFSQADALQYIRETDQERENLHRYFLKEKESEANYDLIIDVSGFTQEKVVSIILHAFECKNIPEDPKKVPYF